MVNRQNLKDKIYPIMNSKVIMITHEYPPYKGGAGIYCEELAYAANKIGVDIEVWAPKGAATNNRFSIIELPWKGSQGYIASCCLITYFLKQKLTKREDSIIHLAELGSMRAFVRFGWLLHFVPPPILTIHGSELLRFTRNPLEKWLFKKLLQRAIKIHVLSKYNKTALLEFCPKIKKRIHCISGAPARRVIPRTKKTSTILDAKKLNILCVGRIHPRKGQTELLKALCCLTNKVQKELVVTFVGAYTKQKYFKKLNFLKNSFAGEVLFTGQISDDKLKSYFQSSDIFALTSVPSHNSVEGFGFVYLEASANALPVIANRVGGVEDVVLDGTTGLLSEPNDPISLAENIIKLVENPKLREKLGGNGRIWAAKHSWGDVAKKLYELH